MVDLIQYGAMNTMSVEAILVLLLALIELSWQNDKQYIKQQHGVGCYKCHSVNGSDARCGDPFHPAYNMHRYYNKCEQGLDNRVGLFPAKFCTKIKGTNLRTNEEMIVRSCSISELDNVCGQFEFENSRYSGCLMSCDTDACNSALSTHTLLYAQWTVLPVLLPGILLSLAWSL